MFSGSSRKDRIHRLITSQQLLDMPTQIPKLEWVGHVDRETKAPSPSQSSVLGLTLCVIT